MPTIKDIAQACNVSVATVSNIVNNKGGVSEKTRARIQKVIDEMEYTPNYVAKNLKMKNSRSIGVIAEDMTVFSVPEIIDGITEHCEKEDYHIFLVNLRLYKKFEDRYYQDNRHKELVHDEIRKLRAKQVDGIIYIGAHERIIDVFQEQSPIPIVVAYGMSGKASIPAVVVNDTQGAEKMTTYLISCGHKKIGVIAGKKESLHTQSRLEGYQSALFKENILYNPELVVYGKWDRASGYQNTDTLIEKGVTALFCMNDFMAGGVYDRLEELGLKIGKDIAVAGYDNREMASYETPPLTTVGLPLHDIGSKASEIIIGLLKDKEQMEEGMLCYVDCELYERKSVNKIEG